MPIATALGHYKEIPPNTKYSCIRQPAGCPGEDGAQPLAEIKMDNMSRHPATVQKIKPNSWTGGHLDAECIQW